VANDRRIADCATHLRRRIVLTGGPGAGKTAVLELFRAAVCEHVNVLPEAAGIVFGGGFPRDDRTKEERVYLPLIESRMSADAQVRLLKRMGRETAPGTPRADEIDIRDIAQLDRHPRVFEEFDRLDVGESLNLVSDHDPRPLSYQFARKHRGAHAWDYVERGPMWRVRITRTVRD
jgi:uncharacterized protein (DUF2249 family)